MNTRGSIFNRRKGVNFRPPLTNVIREIRDLREKGGSLNEISARYGVSQASVSRIVNRQSWAHVT